MPNDPMSLFSVGSQPTASVTDHANQNNNKSIDYILLELYEHDTKMYNRRKITAFSVRMSAQDSHAQESQNKADAHLRTGSLNANILSTVILVIGGYAGSQQSPFYMAFQGASQAFERLGGYMDKQRDADIEGFTHCNQLYGAWVQDLSKLPGEYDQNFERTASKLEQLLQSRQRLIETAAS
jgi:hypothetical protein